MNSITFFQVKLLNTGLIDFFFVIWTAYIFIIAIDIQCFVTKTVTMQYLNVMP